MDLTRRKSSVPNLTGNWIARSLTRVLRSASSLPKAWRNKRIQFIFVYAGLLLFYGASVSYRSSMLVSIEKRFSLSTKQIGAVLSAIQIGSMTTAIFTAHFFGNRHRPRWMCFGTVLMALSFFLFASTEVIFPAKVRRKGPVDTGLCALSNFYVANATNATSPSPPAMGTKEQGGIGPLMVPSIANVFLGLGSNVPLVLGFPYIDDNVAVGNIPLYFGYALFGRIFGPLIGFSLGSILNTVYFDFSKPLFLPSDPRFIGAWHIGFITLGAGLLIFGTLIGFFPKSIPRRNSQSPDKVQLSLSTSVSASEISDTPYKKPPVFGVEPVAHSLITALSWKVLFVDLKRLFQNLAFMCRTASLIVSGVAVSGVLMILAVVTGVLLGSTIIKRFRLEPGHVALFTTASNFLLSTGLFISMGIGCVTTEIQGLSSIEEFRIGHGIFNETFCEASSNCGCSRRNFDPVCQKWSNTNFYSPCFAGCSNVSRAPSGQAKMYHNCDCALVHDPNRFSQPSTTGVPPNNTIWSQTDLSPGLCPKLSCAANVSILTAVIMIALIFEGSPMPGQIMIQFRVVDPDLKNLCAGVTSVLVGALGLLPGPIIIGAVVDSTCRLWQTKQDGGRGYCLFYDTDQFRWKFFLTGACLKFMAGLLDSVVTWKVWRMKFKRPLQLEKNTIPTTTEEAAL